MKPFDYLGPYRVEEPIGRGGMGTVYRAIDEKTGRVVAVKLIALSVADDRRFQRRFEKEIKALTRLKHRNIVTLIAHGEQAGHPFYSMELVEGESLQQKLRREKRLPWPFVLDMAIDVCAALKHAHDFGIIHRDLKTANLLISRDGTTKLVDFGIVKLFGDHEHTAAGSVLGTADFMAPEQADGGPITPRTDLYALGNVMYACFAGHPPFGGRALTRVIESLRTEEPVRIDRIDPDLPAEIAELIHDLLEKRPQDRPPTALAVMNRLKAIRAGLSRRQTLGGDAGDTHVPVPHPNPAAGPAAQASGTPTAVSSADEQTLGRFDDEQKQGGKPAASSDELTIAATLPSELGTDSPGKRTVVSDSEKSRSSHFHTVDETDRLRGDFTSEEESHGSGSHVLSIILLVAALLLGVGVFAWSLRRPSADQLYHALDEARERDDTEAMRDLLDRFSRLYPDDPRQAEFVGETMRWEADRVLSRLKLAAVQRGGADRLAPEEEAFIAAMNHRDRDPRRTRQLLQQWLNVYAHHPETLETPGRVVPLPVMIRAAETELERLEPGELPAHDRRAGELIERIRWGKNNLSDSEQRKMLEGIVSLFAEKPWAAPAVEEAKKHLEELAY